MDSRVAVVAAASILATSSVSAEDDMATHIRASSSASAADDSGADAAESVAIENVALKHRDAASALRAKSGMVVQQAGGVGSRMRLTLDGLSDERIRLFVDGVPFALTGYGNSLAEVPLPLVRRVDVHRGVTPITLSSDALGGALNLISRGHVRRSRLTSSAAVGSFGQFETALLWQQAFPALKLSTQVLVSHQHAENDSFVDVDVANDQGQLEARRVRRFHSAFSTSSFQAGLTSWGTLGAERLSFNAFHASTARDVGANLTMTQPYGAVTYTSTRQGGSFNYVDIDLTPWQTELSVVGALARRQLHLHDVSAATYNWLGDVVVEAGRGEIGTNARDLFLTDTQVFVRATLKQPLMEGFAVEASLAPHLLHRTGKDLAASPLVPDPEESRRQQLKLSGGAAASWTSPTETLNTQVFIKSLSLQQDSAEVAFSGARIARRVHQTAVGVGTASSLRVTEAWNLKASAERAHRAPEANEVFGDGVLVQPNLLLVPENSLNANLTSALHFVLPLSSSFSFRTTGFARQTENLIVLTSSGTTGEHKNMGRADTFGASIDLDVSVLGGLLVVALDATAFDKRNRSKQGVFAETYGDRVPNEPWMTASSYSGIRVDASSTAEVSCGLRTAYTRGFFVGFESQGARESKRTVPSQLWYDVGCQWQWRHPKNGVRVEVAGTVTNLTDAPLFDFYGVQRPGRAWLLKLRWQLASR